MIALTNAVVFGTETDGDASLATAKFDALNRRLEICEVYGNGPATGFVPSASLPGRYLSLSLTTGVFSVDGITVMRGGEAAALTTAQLANVQSALQAFQHAVETELVALGIFSGTVS